uniref:Aspartokinase n=1 Tax=Chlamydomonas leiostraca TaxID=1034604 RepID=A0A7S0R5D6_9CHLO
MQLNKAPATARAARQASIVKPAAVPTSRAVVSRPVVREHVACTRTSARRVATAAAAAPAAPATKLVAPGKNVQQANVVYKFGGSSVRDAERMREVADIICSFPDLLPVVVLSAMGKSTNMLLECGDLALKAGMDGMDNIPNLPPLLALRKLHMDTCDELRVEPTVKAEVEKMLSELQQLLIGICIMQDLTPRAKDSLVSFGERLATRIFASYLRVQGIPARQYDAWELGMTTTDDFTNADVIYEETLPKIKANLTARAAAKEVAVVTGFLGKGLSTGAITTLGRGGSDLTATVLGAALELKEVQVWKDVDGVLTSDPRIVSNTRPVNELTFEEATELAYFGAQVLHPQAMQPAIRSGKMGVRVKNSYNRTAPGTVISAARDMSSTLVTSIVLKNSVTLVDIISTRMMGQYGFLATVFEAFRKYKLSVDVVATSEVSVSLTLDPKKITDMDSELQHLKEELGRLANVSYRNDLAIVSLICNVQRTSNILENVFDVLDSCGINVVMMSQGASKTNISLVIEGRDGQRAVQALHKKFFEELPHSHGPKH